MSKYATKTKRQEKQRVAEHRFVIGRKIARAMTIVAGVLGLIVAAFSAVATLWVPAAVFTALAAVAFYLGPAMTVDLRESAARTS